jgi:hypothetical protein
MERRAFVEGAEAVWKAAQGRDLALIPLTLLFAAVLQMATWLPSNPEAMKL